MEALINIDVPDLERAIRFYEDGLGLRLSRKLFSGTVAEMAGAPSAIYLLAKPEGSAPTPSAAQPRAYSRHWTPVHLDFVVDDLDSAVAKAQRAGARLEAGPEALEWGRQATLSDPFGHGLCLIQWSGSGYDAVT
jgi:predicted enzyme related to lactoylglutathione lyase